MLSFLNIKPKMSDKEIEEKKLRDKKLSELKEAVHLYGNEIKKLGEFLDDEKCDAVNLFSQYDKIKKEHSKYLAVKKELIDLNVNLSENVFIHKFKDLHKLVLAYEKELLIVGFDVKTKTINTNTELLDAAFNINRDSTNKLKDALAQLHETNNIGTDILSTLEDNKKKIKKITSNLDEIDSELELAKRRITVFAKRLATDKVIISATLLTAAGITVVGLGAAGIIPGMTIPHKIM